MRVPSSASSSARPPIVHLVEFLAVLLHPENADVADVMVAAGVNAAGNIDVQTAERARQIVIAETPRQLLRDRDRARVGEVAIVEPRARDDVGHQPNIRGRDAEPIECAPQLWQVALCDVGQCQVLLVIDADTHRNCSGRRNRRWHPSARRSCRRGCRSRASARASRSRSPASCDWRLSSRTSSRSAGCRPAPRSAPAAHRPAFRIGDSGTAARCRPPGRRRSPAARP